jgi:hypothetical protein
LALGEPAIYEPDPGTRAAYEDAYGRYRRLFDAVEPGFNVDDRPATVTALA